jgi:thioredoxin-like negative regulator of GroEL
MNGLLFLSSEDFMVNEINSEKLLCTQLNQGILLVLFYSTQCEHCKNAIPIFRQLPQSIHGCSFGMINVSTNAKVVHMARNTISNIQYVPLIVLYVNGEPTYKYKGPINLQDIQKFIVQMSKLFESKQQFVKPQDQGLKKIPEYCTAIPYCNDDVCYLEFNDAYDKNKQPV